MEKVSYYRNVVPINVVEFIDKECNDIQMIKYSIILFEKDKYQTI